MDHPAPGFLRYYLRVITQPSRAFLALSTEPRRLALGAGALGLNAIAYTCVYVFLTLGHGAPSAFKPWLAIASEHYYAYNRFMLAPSMLGGWLLAAAVAQLCGRAFCGAGEYEDLLAVLGYAIGVASLPSLAHDLPDSFLGAIGVVDLASYEVALNSPTVWRAILWTLYVGSALWFVVLFTLAIRAVQRVSTGRAFGVGFVSFAVYQFVFVIFNR